MTIDEENVERREKFDRKRWHDSFRESCCSKTHKLTKSKVRKSCLGPKCGNCSQGREKRCKELLAGMIIMDEMHFLTVESKAFCNFVTNLEPRFPFTSRYTMMKDCLKMHATEKARMKDMFISTGQRVSFTTDMWTSIQNLSYMCITAHFIDSEWTLHKRILGFKRIQDNKGSSIGKELDDCMTDWGIKKSLTITVDVASANDSAIEWLKRNCTVSEDSIRDHEFIHVRCYAHVINLIVNEGLKEVDDSIIRVRNIVKYMLSSPQRLDKFKLCVKQLKISCGSMLTLDVPTRWNTTYTMLDVASKYQRAFERMEFEDGGLYHTLSEDKTERKGLRPLDTHDWDNMRYFVQFLKLFYDTTIRISGSLYCTANMYFQELSELCYHLQQKCESSVGLLNNMAMMMKSKYDQYWGDVEKINRLIFVAAILDPRYKLVVVEYWMRKVIYSEKANQFIRILKNDIEALYHHYNNSGQSSSADGSFSRPTDLTSSLDDTHDSSSIDWLQRYQIQASRNIMQCKSEFERYFMEDVEAPNNAFHILTWWKVNSIKFPVLSRVAWDVLVIPITTVASESAFSTRDRVLDDYRSSLAPRTLEALICTQNWLRSNPIGLDSVDDAERYKRESGIQTAQELAAQRHLSNDHPKLLEEEAEVQGQPLLLKWQLHSKQLHHHIQLIRHQHHLQRPTVALMGCAEDAFQIHEKQVKERVKWALVDLVCLKD